MTINHLVPIDELLFLLIKVIGFEQLFSLSEYAHLDLDIVNATLSEGVRFASDKLVPLQDAGDLHGARLEKGRVTMPPGFRKAYTDYVQGGWPSLDMPQEHGGHNMPFILQAAFAEIVNGACTAFGMFPVMGRAAAHLLIAHGKPELVHRLVPSLVSGEYGATISISESHAGSDVGRIATRAVPDIDGNFRINGTKMFISYADHDLTEQIIHVVLARSPNAPSGTRGLSLFVVPRLLENFDGTKSLNNIDIIHVERKMGLKASPTCVINFDESRGYLVGEVHQGLKAIFTMVKAMRLEVAVQGVAIAGAATKKALLYSTERLQGGSPNRDPVAIVDHADVRRMLYEMRARTEGTRALVLETAFQLDLARYGTGTTRPEARKLAEWLLPICKAYCSETGFEVANMALQVYGGHGYISDSGIEQYVRDSRVMSIYEGTNGIQALDLVTRKLAPDGSLYRVFSDRISRDLERFRSTNGTEEIRAALQDGLVRLERSSQILLAAVSTARRDAEAGASAYLKMAALVGVGWMWLRMAAAASHSPLEREKHALARFYSAYLMPEILVLEKRVLLGSTLFEELEVTELAGVK